MSLELYVVPLLEKLFKQSTVRRFHEARPLSLGGGCAHAFWALLLRGVREGLGELTEFLVEFVVFLDEHEFLVQ